MSDTAENTAQLGSFNVLAWSLARPFLGVYTLEAEVDVDEDEAPPAGTLDFTFATDGAPVTYRVTVIDVLEGGDLHRETLGRHRVFAVGGAGGLRKALPGRDYAEVDPRLVFEDILSEAGELVDLSAVDAPHLARWVRSAGTGRAALTRLCERLGTGWRVGRTGAVKAALESWPSYSETPPEYLAEPDSSGVALLDLDAPDLDPGMSILRPEGQSGDPYRVSSVVYSSSEVEGVLRTRVTLQRPEGGQGARREQWRAAVVSVLPPFALYVPHLVTVVDQDDDGLVGVRFDGRGAPLLTISAVPIWAGLPGAQIKLKKGARCLLQFAGGQEDSPLITGFAPGDKSEFKTITLGKGPPDTTAQVLQIGSDS